MKNNFNITFIGIGAHKSGTTWLANCLREHPEICFANKKEVLYFNKLANPLLSKTLNIKYNWGLSWYKNASIIVNQEK